MGPGFESQPGHILLSGVIFFILIFCDLVIKSLPSGRLLTFKRSVFLIQMYVVNEPDVAYENHDERAVVAVFVEEVGFL